VNWLVRAAQAVLNTAWRGTHGSSQTEKAMPGAYPVPGHGGWLSLIEEPFAGAWQRNITVSVDTALTYSAVFRCISLISSDIAKMRVKLVRLTDAGVWQETENPAFSPVLRKPNRWQSRIQFFANWMESKLIHGNTYVLKGRDNRNVVTSLHVLDPQRVTVLVAPDSSVFYELRRDDLSGLQRETVTVPESEIIHDRMNTFNHPLVGISPISAASLAIASGLNIQQSSAKFFMNGGRPAGILTAPGFINEETARRLKEQWNSNYGAGGPDVGKTAVLGDGIEYKPIAMTAADAQLIEQLRFTAETVASAFGVPLYMIGVGPPPTYNNIEALQGQYYAQVLQAHIESIEALLDEGLGLGPGFGNKLGVEFDLDGLLRMDTATKVKAAADALKSGALAPNEARARYFGLPPTEGGESPYLQIQNYSLAALSRRDANSTPVTPGLDQPNEEPKSTTSVSEVAESQRIKAIRQAAREFHRLADQESLNGHSIN
jgi:HK97 family phage portal protein